VWAVVRAAIHAGAEQDGDHRRLTVKGSVHDDD
jgi:hypothetical protein